MAYDPEARRQSNSALTIGLVALGLIGACAIGYLLMKPAESPTIIQTAPRTEIVEKTVDRPVPVTVPQTSPDVVVIQPGNVSNRPATSSSTTTTSTTIRSIPGEREPAPSEPGTSTTNNTTVNVTAPTAAPAPPETATTSEAPADTTTTTTTNSSE